MMEVMEGAGVYWYSHQRAYCNALKSWQGYINSATDMFFTKETLAASPFHHSFKMYLADKI